MKFSFEPVDSHEKSTETSTKIYGGTAGVMPPTAIPENQRAGWSPALQNLLDQPPATLPQRFVAGGIAFCVIFGGWAWLGKIEEVGKAQGKLVPQGQTYKVETLDTSKVALVAVEEGETVKAGQVLVELDGELLQKEIDRLQAMLESYSTQIEQKQSLLARIGMEAQTRAAIASAETLAHQSAIAMNNEKIISLRQLLAQMYSEASAHEEREARLQPLADLAHQRIEQIQAEVAAHQQRLNKLLPLLEEGAISQEFIFQAQQQLRNTQQQLTQAQIQDIPGVEEQLFAAQRSQQGLEARIIQHRGELNSVLDQAEALQAQLMRKQIEEQQIGLEAEQKIAQLEVEITQLEANVTDTQNLLATAEAKLKDRFLKAPVDGVVLSLNLQNTGQVVQPGHTVAEIAPHGAPLVLEAALPNREAGFVEEGMPVRIKLEAYPYQDYGVVPGKVVSVSADSQGNEQLGEIYTVEVALDRDYITEEGQKITFKPGQTATANIVIRSRRIADVLLDPIKQMQKGGLDL